MVEVFISAPDLSYLAYREKHGGGFFSEADSTSTSHSLSKMQAFVECLLVVEVPGIEPGSFRIKTGLLRA